MNNRYTGDDVYIIGAVIVLVFLVFQVGLVLMGFNPVLW